MKTAKDYVLEDAIHSAIEAEKKCIKYRFFIYLLLIVNVFLGGLLWLIH